MSLEKSARASRSTSAAWYANKDGLRGDEVARSLGSDTAQKSLVSVIVTDLGECLHKTVYRVHATQPSKIEFHG